MRLIKGLVALVILAVLVVGIPAALVLLGGNPLPDQVSWTGLVEALLRRDDGTVLLGLVTVIGWLAWLTFALSLAAELVRLLSGSRVRLRLPGLAGPQRLVSGLLLAVIALLALPAGAHASPPAASPAPASAPSANVQPARPERAPEPLAVTSAVVATKPASARDSARPVTHQVQRGDDLWSLAERYYGQGRDWRKIATANPDVLTGGPDQLQPGWRLVIPDVDRALPGSDLVTVAQGDSLSSIAERAYGRADRWKDVFDANRDKIEDPDEIDIGTEIRVPGLRSTEGTQKPQRTVEQDQENPRTNRRAQGAAPSASEPNRQLRSPGTAPVPTASVQTARVPTARVPTAPVPTAPVPTASVPTAAHGTEAARSPSSATATPTARSVPSDQTPADAQTSDQARVDVALGVGAVGGLLAASVLAGLSLRRRAQLQTRPAGRRIVHPPPPAQAVETALGHRQQPLSPGVLDLALRALAAHCHRESVPLPALASIALGRERLELAFAGPIPAAPVGFRVAGQSWLLDQVDADYLASVPGVDRAARPYPALATLGRDRRGNQVLVDLETWGLLALDCADPQVPQDVLAALAAELSFTPWADELVLTLVGSDVAWPEALGKHNVTRTDDIDGLLLRLERRAEAQRAHAPHQVLGQHRLDPDLADAWVPEIVLVHETLTAGQSQRLIALATAQPRTTLAAVTSAPLDGAPAVLRLTADPNAGAAAWAAELEPLGLTFEPQLLPAPAATSVLQLVASTGSDATTPAPWWAADEGPPIVGHSAAPPGSVTFLGKRFGGWGGEGAEEEEESSVMQESAAEDLRPHHPILRILGPVELVGATGTPPPRAGKQCLEYCGWLLEHPGTSAQAMAAALVVAEGTRRSNMSRLRSWLGADDQGQPYLPDAYTGRILLHPSVSSDWQRLQILTAAGVNVTSTPGLRAALELVRGAPLADAAPGQWHWAEELRTDMVSAIRDIGVQLTGRALSDGDVDLARWAAARALVAAPGDELLTAARIRTEHLAGNVPETERLTLQLAAQARSLGTDLNPETVTLLQQVMEGRVRARLA